VTHNRRDDPHLDAAIDRAVRDMMSAEPRAGLRERVLAELAGDPVHAAWWPRLAFGSAAIAVAIVILLVIVNRPAERPIDQTIAGAAPPPVAAPGNTGEPGQLSGGTPPVRVTGPRAGTLAGSPVVEDRPIQAASIETGESIAIEPMTAVERLAPIDPIRIARLETPTLSDISIKPITIERIEITPLTPPSPQR
jgi:hypothetical protein